MMDYFELLQLAKREAFDDMDKAYPNRDYEAEEYRQRWVMIRYLERIQPLSIAEILEPPT